MKNILTIILFLTLIVPAVAIDYSYYFKVKGNKVLLEQAVTFEEKREGLMYRDSLKENTGMVFLYDDYFEQSFWMKNVKIPLDIVFLSDQKIVRIYENVPPCENKYYCKVYHSGGRVNKVVELNAGFCDKHDLDEGDEIVLRKL